MEKRPTMRCRRSFGIQFAFVAVASILLCVNISSAAFTPSDWTPIYQGVWVASGWDTTIGTAVYAIRVDTAHPAVSMFATAHSGPYETTLQTTPGFMSYYACEVAINANFSYPSGSYANVNGLLISNGSVVSVPDEAGFISQLRITSDNVATLADDWGYPAGIHTAVGGGYYLLLAGENYGEYYPRRARSAVGLTQDGRFIILAVAQRNYGGVGSSGGSTMEMSYWIEAFGAYYAFNLDGGGSSSLCSASGGMYNYPGEDGTPRLVGANLGVNSTTYDPRMDVWFIGSTGTVKKKTWTKSGGWDSTWGDYNAPACGINPVNGITAVSRGPSLLDLFVIGNDNKIYRKSLDGTWSPWDTALDLPSGVSCSSGLDACAWDIGRIDIVIVGDDGHLYRKTAHIGVGWDAWVDEGGGLDPDQKPTIVAWGPNRLDIFAADDDGVGIMHRRYNGSSWLAWVERAGNSGYGLDAVSSSYGKVHVFYTTSAGEVYRRTYDDNGDWSGATNLGGSFDTAPGSVSYEQGHLMVFARNASDGKCYRRNYQDGSWWSWSNSLNGYGISGAPDSCSWSNDAGTHLP